MLTLEAHAQKKAGVVTQLRALAVLADEVGMATLAGDLRETRIPKVESEQFHLVILGEFNHGKSTFVNAVLGADILPTGITPTTATINHVVWSDSPRARAITLDGQEIPVAPSELAAWVTVDGTHRQGVRYVEVGHPAPMLRDHVTLVDTPGVNDLNEQRAEITYGYVPRADAVIFLLDASQALKESERAFLTTRVLERSRDRMVFVVGKTDLLSEGELAEVLGYVRGHLAGLVAEPPVFAVSARRHLAGDTAGSGMAPLLAFLEDTLTKDRGRVLLDNAAGDALAQAAYLRQSLGVKRRTLTLTLTELEERVTKVRAQLAATEKTLGDLHGRIKAEGEAVKAQLRLDVDQFAGRFTAALPAEIEAADAADLRRYLPHFVQDKFKEWAEREGERLSVLLERLAEEVISVTNENTRLATAAIADRLAPGDAHIEVEVDSFRYDVSVYAVGALGTTVFLFVNTLVGGLLTLAAPILAIVLQSRVAAEVKAQAKERAPEAVRRAAAAIAPHFEGIVVDFTNRLDAFVASAGDKLFRGLGEVLDRAVAERRAGNDEVAPIALATDAHLERLTLIERELSSLRTALWTEDPDKDA